MQSDDIRTARILSITGEDRHGRQVDLKPILDAFGDALSSFAWAVTSLDCFGPDTSELCQSVHLAERRQEGVWIAGEDLAMFAARVTQTIEAALLAFPKEQFDIDLREAAFHQGGFLRSKAVIEIEIRDNTYYHVISKDSAYIERIKSHFPHTREEDPTAFGLA